MKIKELNIIEFGGLSHRRYELDDGLNVFEGENEAGKSTIWLFIKFMLFGMPKKGHPERQKSINRTSHLASGTMTVLCGGETYRIERSFSENSRSKGAITYRLSDGERVFDGEEPGEALLGVTRDIFENSVSIGQTACASLGGEKGAAAMRNILSSADEEVDIDKILKKLDGIRILYRHRKGSGGRLYELSQSINLLEGRLGRATDNRLKAVELESRLASNQKNIEAADAELEELREITGRLQTLEIVSRFDRLSDSRQALAAADEELHNLVNNDASGGHFPTMADAAGLAASANACERAERALSEAQNRLERLYGKEPSEERQKLAEIGALIEKAGGSDAVLSSYIRARTKKAIGYSVFGAGAVLLIASLALTFSLHPLFSILAGICAVGGGVGLWFGILGASEIKKGVLSSLEVGEKYEEQLGKCVAAYGEAKDREAEITKTRSDVESAEGHYSYLFDAMSSAMARTAPNAHVSIENARAEAIRLNQLAEKHRRLSERVASLRTLIDGEEKILSIYNEKELRAAAIATELPSYSLTEAENKKRFYDQKLGILRQKEAELKTELINLQAFCEDPAVLRDQLCEKKKSYEASEEYYDAVVLAMEAMERAAASLRGSITPIIGKTAGDMIERISGGRYSGVTMGQNLDIALVDKDGLTTTVDMMSGGMKDAAYIALRISLMLRIFGDELPPLMMDEALCQLDDRRMGSILELLSALCADGCQCIVFTCHTREWAACQAMGITAKHFQLDSPSVGK